LLGLLKIELLKKEANKGSLPDASRSTDHDIELVISADRISDFVNDLAHVLI